MTAELTETRELAEFERFTPDQVEQTIPERFGRQVAKFAGRPAVIDGGKTWTYGELAASAAKVAGAIASTRAGEQARIGLLGLPGAQLVAATLGILQAGGTVVPLDPLFPAQRLASIAMDAELALVVAGDGLTDMARGALGQDLEILDLAGILSAPGAMSASDGSSLKCATARDPAYLLYTSGSTGEPKGTLHSHRQVLHRIRVYTNAVSLDPHDRVLLIAKPTFVAWVTVLFGALLNGAAACIVDLAEVGFVGLRDLIGEENVTATHSTPTVYRELVATLAADERLSGVRAVALGGEEVRVADFDAFRQHFATDAIFVNVMASTESSIGLVFVANATSTIAGASIPAGFPAEATEVLLLDASGEPAESVGEIAFRSRFIPAGYWKRPELTAATFRHDAADPDLVTYRTGDLGRRRDDGAFEFAGRRDRQVKVRGIRVEIAEVEQALAALPQVRQVAVEAHVMNGETELVAYLEPSGAECPAQHELSQALRNRLPEYMLPSAAVWLDRLPRTSSNKIDRRALPDPPVPGDPAPAAQARDDVERQLLEIWERVLARPVGLDDNFFDIGGNSLKAVRLCDRIWREMGHRLAPSVLLGSANIGLLAEQLRQGDGVGPNDLVPVQPAGTQRPLFIVPGAGSRILYVRNLAVHLGLDQPIYALHQPPSGRDGHVERRVEDLAAHYVTALRKVQPHGPYDLVGISFGGVVAFEVAQQLLAAGQQVGLLALIDSRHPAQPQRHRSLRPRALARRVGNQAGIVRRLGPRRGAAYLSGRLRIQWTNSLEAVRERLGSRLPGWLGGVVRDPSLQSERDWLEADGRAFDRYQTASYPGRITFLWAEHSPTPPEHRYWAELAAGGFDPRGVPGGHFTALVEPLVGITAGVLRDALAEARSTGAHGNALDRPVNQRTTTSGAPYAMAASAQIGSGPDTRSPVL